jgi:hypothetical protein
MHTGCCHFRFDNLLGEYTRQAHSGQVFSGLGPGRTQ